MDEEVDELLFETEYEAPVLELFCIPELEDMDEDWMVFIFAVSFLILTEELMLN